MDSELHNQASALADAVVGGADVATIVRSALAAMSQSHRDQLAEEKLYDWVRKLARARARAIEQKAFRGTRPTRVNFLDDPNDPDFEIPFDGGNIGTHFTALIERYAQVRQMEWKQELLATSFTLRDGTTRTWGAATIQEHMERAAMFQRNAEDNTEGAVRHLVAVRDITEAEVDTLNELVAEAHAQEVEAMAAACEELADPDDVIRCLEAI